MLLNTVVVLCRILTVPYGLAYIYCKSVAFPGYTHFFLYYTTGKVFEKMQTEDHTLSSKSFIEILIS